MCEQNSKFLSTLLILQWRLDFKFQLLLCMERFLMYSYQNKSEMAYTIHPGRQYLSN